MSTRKSSQPTKATPSPEATTVEKLPDLLTLIIDDLINAHALVTVAYRVIDEWDDEDRGAAVRVLGKNVEAFDDIADKLERLRVLDERRGAQGGGS